MKKTLIILTVAIAILIGGYFILNSIAHNKIEQFLDEQVARGDLEYQDFNLSLLRGNVTVNTIEYHKQHQQVQAEQVGIKGLSYWNFLVSNRISVDHIVIRKPLGRLHKKKDAPKHNEQNKKQESTFDKEIRVKHLAIEEGQLTYTADTSDLLRVALFDLDVHHIRIDQQTLQQKVPATYEGFSLKLSGLWYDMNELQEIQATDLHITDKEIRVTDLHLLPKYTRQDYIRVIPYEKDLMSLKLDSLSIPEYQLELQGRLPLFEAPKIVFEGIDFDIYRDKTVNDDLREKPLYSKMLRDLDIELNIDSIVLKNTNINYQERIKKDRDPGEVYFSELQATITNITNTDLERNDFPETQIDIRSLFMGKSPISVEWQFRINDKRDNFRIRGKSSDIPEESINSFFIPAFNVKTEGTVNELYFNFGGNNDMAAGDFQIDHENFEVQVLKKNGKEKKGFLSWVANIFVKKGNKGESLIKHVKEVKRDKTKSFWNYFWSCIQAGLTKTMI